MTTISPLTAGGRRGLPPPCVACVFWQHDRLTTDERRKEAWAEGFERRHGAFGRVLRDADGFQGMVQYGPASSFPRALGLPAGPPTRDAALVTCTFLEARDPAGACERLMLEALADLKARGYPAVEARAGGEHPAAGEWRTRRRGRSSGSTRMGRRTIPSAARGSSRATDHPAASASRRIPARSGGSR
jgi:hypothetical protein